MSRSPMTPNTQMSHDVPGPAPAGTRGSAREIGICLRCLSSLSISWVNESGKRYSAAPVGERLMRALPFLLRQLRQQLVKRLRWERGDERIWDRSI